MNEELAAMRSMPEPMPYQPPTVELKEEYRPSNQEALREYEIRLQFLNRGCIVHVGCKSIAFETVESAMKEVNEYVNNTWDSQQRWRKLLN
jgi:hypothetical protein